MSFTRRHIALGGAAALAAPFTAPLIAPAWAQSSSLKVGLMLPYSGTYAQLGEAITRGIDLYVKQNNGALAGRKIEFVKVDDESEPTKCTERDAGCAKSIPKPARKLQQQLKWFVWPWRIAYQRWHGCR